LIEECRGRGGSVVLSAHVLASGLDRCDRIVLLRDGRVALSGTRREVLEEPDVLEARVRGVDAATLARAVEGTGGRLERVRPGQRDLGSVLARRTEPAP